MGQIREYFEKPPKFFNLEDAGRKGWKCPVCGRGMAPWMPSCDCNNKPKEEKK